MKPILVHAHVFYSELWPELKSCIQNLADYPFELFVTMVVDNNELKADVVSAFPKAHIEVVENRGFDVGPFVHVLSQVDLDDYSYVVKLHTKRDMFLGAHLKYFDMSGAKWRLYALAILKSEKVVKNIISAFEKDKKLGMVADYHLIVNKEQDDIQAQQEAIKILKQLGYENISYGYVAGTMFWCRAFLLSPLKRLGFDLSDFEESSAHCKISTKAHVLERLLGCLVFAQSQKIADSITFIQFSGKICETGRKMKRFFFQRKMDCTGKIKVKICGIGFSIEKCRDRICNKGSKMIVSNILSVDEVSLSNNKRLRCLVSSLRHPFNKQKRRKLREELIEKYKVRKSSFKKDPNFNVKDIPIYLISYNRLGYLQQMITKLEMYGLTNIHIIDNHSDYEPLLAYLNVLPYHVYFMDKNYGHRVFWESGLFDDIIQHSLYIVSDPDIEFNADLPDDFLSELYRLLGEYKCVTKVGFALKIDDLPQNKVNETVIAWESRFWKNRLKDRLDIYHADIDTTFALYRPGKLDERFFYSAIRVAGNFTAKHLPWYQNGNNADDIKHYNRTSDSRFASWTKDIQRYNNIMEG